VPAESLRTSVVEPDPARAPLYAEAFDRYARVYPATRDVMHRLSGGDSA
jgi:sugar (pentulose or hexulose) kinase